MPTFILTLNWTEQGIHAVKDAPKRSQAAKELEIGRASCRERVCAYV